MVQHTVTPICGNKVLVEARTPFGKKEMAISCSWEMYQTGALKYHNGALMQEAFYFLSADEREFLISGTTPEEWDAMFPENEVD